MIRIFYVIIIVLQIFLQYVVVCSEDKNVIDVSNTLVWGPGLNERFDLPVRYFYIQAVNKNREKYSFNRAKSFIKSKLNHFSFMFFSITSSIGEDAFSISVIDLSTNQPARAYIQLVDRNDGSYIVRFRLFYSYDGLKVLVSHKYQRVAQSPYIIKGKNLIIIK